MKCASWHASVDSKSNNIPCRILIITGVLISHVIAIDASVNCVLGCTFFEVLPVHLLQCNLVKYISLQLACDYTFLASPCSVSLPQSQRCIYSRLDVIPCIYRNKQLMTASQNK